MLSKQDKQSSKSCFSYLSPKLLLAYFLRLKAKCLLKNCAVYSRIYIEFQLLHFFVEKIARLFRGQIDPLIIFGRDILNWRNGAAWLKPCGSTLPPPEEFLK